MRTSLSKDTSLVIFSLRSNQYYAKLFTEDLLGLGGGLHSLDFKLNRNILKFHENLISSNVNVLADRQADKEINKHQGVQHLEIVAIDWNIWRKDLKVDSSSQVE